jgi:hypothetical protein
VLKNGVTFPIIFVSARQNRSHHNSRSLFSISPKSDDSGAVGVRKSSTTMKHLVAVVAALWSAGMASALEPLTGKQFKDRENE